ncbi:urease accessory protein UreF [Halalkalibacter sp. APA_J-10(15)]|uniref:urease accessory protein UreF n=1 Tax=unclassified Halalkalibacter TaxID=2893063 RepID=UPI001FF37AC3|nr:urease accessory protein UreF [Halalkalibacter sp. APA_J-10(15)]MCK0471800.1 urease accessory protein UreF [Halalkalibacter sp. APA_J-10(15)]
MTNQLFPLLQLSDSNFPSGAFSHSFGLETYIQEGVIADTESFKQALVIYVEKQLKYIDGLACRLGYEALRTDDFSSFFELDQLLHVSCLAEETRLGNKRIGERMAKLCYELYPSEALLKYLMFLKEKQAHGHSALVFATVAYELQLDIETAVETYLFTTLSSLVQNAVRGIPLGQTDGQRILVELQTDLKKVVEGIFSLTIDDLGAISPGLEVAQMCHERLHVRLFMS